MEIALIGIDCATDPGRVGLALGRMTDRSARLVEACAGSEAPAVAETVASWIQTAGGRCLLALDAPLGWPLDLARALPHHRAGERLPGEPNRLFRRETDRFIKDLTGKLPLDVGADRIARTAWAALDLLGTLRRLTRRPIPLAWTPEWPGPVAAIEVYPAGTLKVLGLPASGYKRPEQGGVRKAIVEGLSTAVGLPGPLRPVLLANADVLDAAICVAAAADFLSGAAVPPGDRQLAEAEGWIWVRRPPAA